MAPLKRAGAIFMKYTIESFKAKFPHVPLSTDSRYSCDCCDALIEIPDLVDVGSGFICVDCDEFEGF